MDGEMWAAHDAGAAADGSSSESGAASTGVKGCRDMAQCFTHGQRIRHTIGIDRTWIGIYDSTCGRIVYDGLKLTLNAFAMAHYRAERSDRISVNAWSACECEVGGVWISTYSLG